MADNKDVTTILEDLIETCDKELDRVGEPENKHPGNDTKH